MKDKKKILFGLLNIAQGGLVVAIPLIATSREPIINWVLGAAAALMFIAGPALFFGGPLGKKIAALACLIHGVIGTILAALIASSAAYLYGIYGRHGHAAGSIGFVLVLLVLTVFWLLPAHELSFLKKQERGQ
ncbi:MAG: hypothetical protein QNJ97_12150 [Myxococcota bacterium]|nr:hypothetical protein [Myxococcota bacterium]